MTETSVQTFVALGDFLTFLDWFHGVPWDKGGAEIYEQGEKDLHSAFPVEMHAVVIVTNLDNTRTVEQNRFCLPCPVCGPR